MELPIKIVRKRIRKKLLILLFIVSVIVGAGIVYEHISEYFDSKEYKPVGKIVDEDGHNMHIWAEGTGDVTVVFGVGYQMPSSYVDFYPLYREISKQARVAVYDRPGYGWSDVASTPRDMDTITKEIHELLEKSGEKPPYILVAHSISSLEAIRFTQLYTNEVKGVVLIDGSNPSMYTNMQKQSSLAYALTSMQKGLICALNKIGITRILFHTVYPYSSTPMVTARNSMELAPENLKKLDESLFLRTFNNRNQVAEGENKEKNASDVLSHGYLGDIPLRIFTSEQLNNYPESKENQHNLLKWSTNSKQIVVNGSGHAIHWSSPDVINNEIIELINAK